MVTNQHLDSVQLLRIFDIEPSWAEKVHVEPCAKVKRKIMLLKKLF